MDELVICDRCHQPARKHDCDLLYKQCGDCGEVAPFAAALGSAYKCDACVDIWWRHLQDRYRTECGMPDDESVEESTGARVIPFPRPDRSDWYYARKAAAVLIDSLPELLHDIWRALLARAQTWRHSR